MSGASTISIIGLGRLGTPIAATLAARGFEVVGYDPVEEKVAAVNERQVFLHEPRLAEMYELAGDRLRATTDLAEAVRATDTTVLAVPTPTAPDGSFSLEVVTPTAREVGEAVGSSFSTRDLMRVLYEPATDDMIRPGCRRVVEAAPGAGWTVSVLSNDLGAFHGPEWAASVSLLDLVDHVLDCSDGPALKPDRAAYEWALERLGASADGVLFVDDQPGNVDGARACGIEAIWFDIADAEQCWRSIGERIGL